MMNENTCACCGEIIPEGRQVCWGCEHSIAPKSPSEAQIKFTDFIAATLGIDFPQSSQEFTAQAYYHFIRSHYNEIQEYFLDSRYDGDDEMDWFSPLNQ